MLKRVWQKGTFLHSDGNISGATTMENILEVPQKTKNRVTI